MPEPRNTFWRQVLLLLGALLPLLTRSRSALPRRSTDPRDTPTMDGPDAPNLPGTDTAPPPPKPPKAKRKRRTRPAPSPVGNAFKAKRSDVIVTDRGTVVKLLRDDLVGSRHQRFLIDIDRTDVTVKLAHNIDLSPRIPVSEGDRVEFRGEYEYNELGGAVHWTHLDPKGWHEHGYVEHEGRRYE